MVGSPRRRARKGRSAPLSSHTSRWGAGIRHSVFEFLVWGSRPRGSNRGAATIGPPSVPVNHIPLGTPISALAAAPSPPIPAFFVSADSKGLVGGRFGSADSTGLSGEWRVASGELKRGTWEMSLLPSPVFRKKRAKSLKSQEMRCALGLQIKNGESLWVTPGCFCVRVRKWLRGKGMGLDFVHK